MYCEYIPQSVTCLYFFLRIFLNEKLSFFLILIKVLFIYSFIVDSFCTLRNICLFYSEEDVLLHFLPEAILLYLTFRSMSYFESTFMYGVRNRCPSFVFVFLQNVQFFQQHLLKIFSFLA